MFDRIGKLFSSLRTTGDEAEACKNRGNAHLAKGELEAALACYEQAIALNPSYAEAFNNLGFIRLQQDRLDDAELQLNRALTLNPQLHTAHVNLGNLYLRQNHLDKAATSFQQAISANPKNADAHFTLGSIFQQQGKLDDAITCYSAAASLNPGFFVAHYNLGFLYLVLGKRDEALSSLQRAISLNQNFAEAHYELGNLLAEQNQLDTAVLHFQKAISLRPDNFAAHSNLGLALLRHDKLNDARACFEETIRLKPDLMAAYNNLADVLHKQGRLDEALTNSERAIAIAPECAGPYITKGIVLQDQGRFAEAEVCYRQALSIEPTAGAWRFNIALALLARGELTEGWEYYGSRFYRGSPARQYAFPQPHWAGESLADKSLLIWEDQGIGDEILFASMFQEMIKRSGRCIIECAPKLVPLLARSFPAALVVPRTDPPHPATLDNIDYQIAAGSLAQWLRPTLDSFPQHDGYLAPDPTRIAYWKTRLSELGPGLKVGFCWRSKLRTGLRHLHYTTLDQWGPIFSVPGVHFINLQYDECTEELAEARRRFDIPFHVFEVDLFNDLDEAAALTKALDLVITAPTAASRLAAAQGVATWEMSYGKSWVALGTDHLPWLPAQRLFTRRWDQDWAEIIGEVAEQLPMWAT